MTAGSSPGTSEMSRRDDARGIGGGGKAAALDGGEMLADRVHLADVGAGGEERAVDRLLVGKGEAVGGQGEQRRAAAGDEAEHEIVRPGGSGEREDPARRVFAACVGDRVRGLDDLDPLAGHAVAGAGDDQAFERTRPVRLDGLRHARGGLAGAEHDRAAAGRRRQMRAATTFCGRAASMAARKSERRKAR